MTKCFIVSAVVHVLVRQLLQGASFSIPSGSIKSAKRTTVCRKLI